MSRDFLNFGRGQKDYLFIRVEFFLKKAKMSTMNPVRDRLGESAQSVDNGVSLMG